MLRLGLVVTFAAGLCGCQRLATDAASAVPGGDAAHGRDVIAAVGCGGCHQIPGVAGANGRVGPPLDHLGARTVLAGYFPNTPANLVGWIEAPQRLLPGNAMPNPEINDHDARDVAAYLYSLR
jgi:cytochrome c1